MADTPQPKPYAGGPMQGWARGMNNIQRATELDSDVLRDAVNVNMSAEGEAVMRAGIRQVLAEPNAHSIFSDARRMVWVSNNALRLVKNGVANPVTLLTDVRLKDKLSWTEVNGELYFSNEAINGKVNALDAYELWGIVPPSVAPSCAGSGAQHYGVTCTFVLASGEESGAPMGVDVLGDVPASIALTNIPQSTDARVVATRIYVTGPGGDVFYREIDVLAGVTTAQLNGYFGSGEKLMTQFMTNPPPCRHIEYHHGCIFMAKGNAVFRTEPLGYGYFDNDQNFILFPRDVVMIADVNDGMYVSYEGEMVFIPDIEGTDMTRTQVLPYGAVEYAKCDMPNSPDVMAFTQRGFVMLSEGGKAKNLTEEQIAVDTHSKGCVGVIERDGIKSIVAIMEDGKPNPLVAQDFLDGEAQRLSEL